MGTSLAELRKRRTPREDYESLIPLVSIYPQWILCTVNEDKFQCMDSAKKHKYGIGIEYAEIISSRVLEMYSPSRGYCLVRIHIKNEDEAAKFLEAANFWGLFPKKIVGERI